MTIARKSLSVTALALGAIVFVGCQAQGPGANDRSAAAASMGPQRAKNGETVHKVDGGAVAQPRQPTITSEDLPAALADTNPPTGVACTVHIRRDAMGLAATSPLGLNSGNGLAGKAVSFQGNIDQVGERWIVVKAGNRRFWIPRETILAIETEER